MDGSWLVGRQPPNPHNLKPDIAAVAVEEGESRKAFHQPCLRVSQPAPDVGSQRNDMSARLS